MTNAPEILRAAAMIADSENWPRTGAALRQLAEQIERRHPAHHTDRRESSQLQL